MTTHQPWHLVMPQSVTDGPFGHMGWCIDCQRFARLQELPPADSQAPEPRHFGSHDQEHQP